MIAYVHHDWWKTRCVGAMLLAISGCSPKQRGATAPSAAAPAPRVFTSPYVVSTTKGDLRVAGVRFFVPPGWTPQKPASPEELVRYRLSNGPDAATLIISFAAGDNRREQINAWLAGLEGIDSVEQPEVDAVVRGRWPAPRAMFLSFYWPEEMFRDPVFATIIEGSPVRPLLLRTEGPGASALSTQRAIDSFVADAALASLPPEGVLATAGKLSIGGVELEIPDEWLVEQPAWHPRLAQYSIPGTEGPADLTVFCFGASSGVPANAIITRWQGEFEEPEADQGTTSTSSRIVASQPLKVTVATASGTQHPSPIGNERREVEDGTGWKPRPDWSLFAIVIEGGPHGPVFLQIVGPTSTIQAQSKALHAVARSARPSR